MKHAYLIITHSEFEILSRLLQALDDERNDIYIHFDRKLKKCPVCHTRHAELYILTERADVYWGDISVVNAEYLLFEAAHKHGGYSYYHLLSGVDMPLKSQDYIHRFFEENAGKEFIGYYRGDIAGEINRKVRKWHLFPKNFKNTGGAEATGKKALRAGFIRLQQLVGYCRNADVDFKKGTQWVSLTSGFVGYLLLQKEKVKRMYSHTFCADEIFIQTICWNSPYREYIYDLSDEGRGCLRMIGWKDNRIRDWEEKDWEFLIRSEALFARKFSGRYISVADRILRQILKSCE